MDCYCDYEMPTVHNVSTPTAKKAHKCEECRSTIQPGDKYERSEGLWDGEWQTFKTCKRCLDLREFVRANVPCFCWGHGNLHDDCANTIEEYAHETVGLRFGYLRRKVLIDRARSQSK